MTAQKEVLVFTAIALTMLVALQPVYVAMAWNPLEALFKKPEEQRKQEIYTIVEAFEQEMMEKETPLSISKVEVVNKIYEEEQMAATEYSESMIHIKILAAETKTPEEARIEIEEAFDRAQ